MRASPDRVLLCMLILGACSPKPTVAPEQPTPADETSNQPAAPATDALAAMRAAIDERVDPCQDFYQYACGAWIERAEIPADRPLTTMTMGILDDTEAHLKDMLEQAAARPADDDRERKLGDYYAACMDEAAIDAAGARPLAPALAKIATVKSLQSALEVAAELSAWGPELFYAVDIGPDAKDPKTNLLHVSQGGLGLPSREFYLRADEDSKKVLRAYEAHVAAMLRIAGDAPDDAARWAAQIVALETVLAEGSAPLDQLRDTEKTYNKMGVKALNKLTPGIKWRPVLERGGLGHVEAINVQTPSYFTAMAKHLRTRDAGLLRAAMRFHLVAQLAPQLAREIDQQAFAFTSTLTGQREQRARWSRCVNDTSAALPELVGFYYVERAFAGESKRVATEMIVAVEKAFEAGLDALPWMDDETRARARAKAAKLVNKVGYPDRWRDYSAVQVVRDDYFASFRSARALDASRERAKAGQPVDPDEWHMAPFMLNAYANPTGLEMVFPAGILQPPIFSVDQHMALNFGSSGSIMGHELTHHFDDQGRKFDAQGTMQDWWADEVQGRFDETARCVAEAYNAYEALPGQFVNGQQTLGENIADIGGLKAAYVAFETWAAAHPDEAASPDPSLTPEQLFFLAFGQTWCGKSSPALVKMRLLGDVHAPRQFRANGSVAFNPGFWAAFSCAEGTPMHPADACVVW